MTSLSPKPAKGWPPARRKAQAERIRAAKPWLRSTGPRTAAGKARSRLNALRHCHRSAAMRRLRRVMKMQRAFITSCILPPLPKMEKNARALQSFDNHAPRQIFLNPFKGKLILRRNRHILTRPSPDSLLSKKAPSQ